MLDQSSAARSAGDEANEGTSGAGVGGQSGPRRSWDQLHKHTEEHAAATKRVNDLLFRNNIGKLDREAYRCFTRAHDLAKNLGQASVDCVHMVTALAADSRGREELRKEFSGFDANAVLRTCAEHLAESGKVTLAKEIPELPIGAALNSWIDEAEKLTKGGGPDNLYIELKHLLAAAKGGLSQELKDAWDLLSATGVPTTRKLISDAQEATSRQLDEHERFSRRRRRYIGKDIRKAKNHIGSKIADHDRASDVREKRILAAIAGQTTTVVVDVDTRAAKIIDMLGAMHGDIQKVGARVEARADEILQRIGEHRDENRKSFAPVMAHLVKIDGTTSRTEVKVDGIASARLSNALVSSGLFLAVLLGGAAGWALRLG